LVDELDLAMVALSGSTTGTVLGWAHVAALPDSPSILISVVAYLIEQVF
jgi:hypothetical protein